MRLFRGAAIALLGGVMLLGAGCGGATDTASGSGGSTESQGSQEAQPDAYAVGEPVDQGNLTITVERIWLEEVEYGDGIPPDRHVYATVRAEVQEAENGTADFYPDAFAIRFPDGRQIPSVPVEIGEHVTPMGTVSPGRPLEGEVNFSISTGGEPFPDFEGAELMLQRYTQEGEQLVDYVTFPEEPELVVEDEPF